MKSIKGLPTILWSIRRIMNNVDILLSDEIERVLKTELPKCETEVNIVSAFCKVSTLELLDSFINLNVKKRLLVRFLPSDIASGATDKEIYDYCIRNNWYIYIDNSIHAKTYIFDHVKCIIGSANATNKGLGVADKSNKEASTFFTLDEDSYAKILSLYKDAIVLDEEIYNEIIKAKDDNIIIKIREFKLKERKIECLMSEDFPTELTDIIELYNLKSYKWLVDFLKNKDNKESYFGEITKSIHDVFVKDPRPFRKDIKQHLIDLFDCIKRLKIKEIEITRLKYSECVRYIG